MKAVKYLLILLVGLFILPFSVLADGEEEPVTTTEAPSNKVNIYLFRGEGCPHCQEAEEYFDSLKAEYGEQFQVIDYETWYNEDNAKLMNRVAEIREESASGVPYIIIGNMSWSGFNETLGKEMLEQIKSEYAKDVSTRYDLSKVVPELGGQLPEKETNDVLALFIILLVTGAVCFGVYKARNTVKK